MALSWSTFKLLPTKVHEEPIFYSSDVAAFEHYRHPEYVALCAAPLFYLLGRMLLLAYRGSMQHDPVLFVLTDRQSYLCAALIFSIYLMASL